MPESTFTPAPHSPRSAFHTLGSPFALQASRRVDQCPPPAADLSEPSADHLVYGLTLPSAVATPVVAQEAALIVLDVHGVEERLVEPMIDLVHELTLHACRFTMAGEMIHLVLRGTGDALQAMVHDTHAPHSGSRLADQCAERRKCSLTAVRELAEKHHGQWGFAPAQPPAAGVCSWATLVPVPRHGPRADGA